VSPIWRHPIHERVLEAFGPLPVDPRTAALDAWAQGPGPRLAVEADDRILARWAARRPGAVVLVPIARRLGTALERDALALLHAQLERFTRRQGKCDLDVLRTSIARTLGEDVEGELLVVIDGADRALGWDLGDAIPDSAKLGRGVRIAVGARSIDAACEALGGDRAIPVLRARAEAPRGEMIPPVDSTLELLRGALAPIPLDDLATAASSSPAALRPALDALAPWIAIEDDRVALREDEPPPAGGFAGGLSSFVRRAAREAPLRRYVLDTLSVYLDGARAPRAEYDALTAPAWCAARMSAKGGMFAVAWDARTARRAAGDALTSGAREPETLGALVRAVLVEKSAVERYAAEPGDLLGDEGGLEEEEGGEELPGEPAAWPGDGAQRAHVLAGAICAIGAAHPDAAELLRAAEAAAGSDPAALLELAALAELPALPRPRPLDPELIKRVAAGATVDAIVAEVVRFRLHSDALRALVEATAEERRGPVSAALARRMLQTPSLDVELLFKAVELGPWLPPDEAAELLRRALDELVFAPSRPDLLEDAFGYDLAHLVPLIARLGGAEAVVRVAREVIAVADLLP
jgi:hypothetical protein